MMKLALPFYMLLAIAGLLVGLFAHEWVLLVGDGFAFAAYMICVHVFWLVGGDDYNPWGDF